jgi:tripartite ATP-independent transporter DctM subunit
MEWWLAGSILFFGLVLFLISGLPVAFSLGCLSMIAMFILWGFDGLITLATTAFTTNINFLLIAIPLFIFMGECIAVSGIGEDAFKMIDAWLGFLPGGIAVTTVATCTVFGAVTGFAPASIAAIGPVTIPEMLRRGYDKGFAVGAIATAGGIAIIIPPSILMVIYAFLAEVSVGKLFYGGVIPGLILAAIIITSIVIRASLNPKLAPYRKKSSWRERIRLSIYISPFACLILLVLGTIWGGIATPTEAAALGALGGLILLCFYGRFNWQILKGILLATVRINCMVMFILIGATLFTQVLAYIGFTAKLAQFVVSLEVSKWLVLGFIMLAIFFLGCLMDAGSILFITIPIFLPIVKMLGFDLLWFGIVILINLEISTITPPVGLNLYVLKGISPPQVSMKDIIRGSAPYWIIDALSLIFIVLFPATVTWLPNILIK